MCVKEFLGYNCGHCSIPYLRQCPLTESDPTYPPCKFPAERPIFTNENCHACARVLWNKKVLEEEAKHRDLHQNGMCRCEVIFDAEERGRRMRPRAPKGKGKMRELPVGDYTHGHDHDVSSAGEGGGSGIGYQGRHGGVKPAVNPGGYEGRTMQGENSREEWEAKLAAYEYVGYFIGDREGSALAHVEKGYGFPEGGYVREDQLWEGQLRIGQPGSGMKWYPEQQIPVLPALPALPPVPHFNPVQFTGRSPRTWQRATSEPVEGPDYHESPRVVLSGMQGIAEVLDNPTAPGVGYGAGHGEQQGAERVEAVPGPVVVSSDMGKTVSK